MKLKHPHLRDVEIDVPADRVGPHLRAGWIKKRGERERRAPEQTGAVTDGADNEKVGQDG